MDVVTYALAKKKIPKVFFNADKSYLWSTSQNIANQDRTIDLSEILGENFNGEDFYYECYIFARDYKNGSHEFEMHSDLMNKSDVTQGQPLYIQGSEYTRHCQAGGTLYAQRYIYVKNITSSENRRIALWWVKAVPKDEVILL